MKSLSPRSQCSLVALFVVIFLAFPVFVYFSEVPINHDTGWFLYAAQGMLEGGVLYRDFFDVNAPMAYVTMMPAACLIAYFGMPVETAFTLNMFAFILPIYFLTAQILHRASLTPAFFGLIMGGIFLSFTLLAGYAFGQREHIFALLSLPYILAAGFRQDPQPLSRPMAFLSGAAAGVGATIKLPFLILILMVEAALLVRRRGKIVIAADLVGAVVAFVLISLLSFWAYPVYWMKIVPSVLPLYAPYNNIGFLTDALFLLLPLFMVGLFATNFNGRGKIIAMRGMLALATLSMFVLFILQQKGWPHQAVPIMIFLVILCLFNLAELENGQNRRSMAVIVKGTLSVLCLLSASILSFSAGRVDPAMIEGVRSRMNGSDGSFYIMSTGNYPAFPLGLEQGTHWASRFPQLILLPGLIEAQREGHQSFWEPWFRAAVLEDIEQKKPSTIFVFLGRDVGMPADIDVLSWFRSDKDFEKEWSYYQPAGQLPSFAVFVRKNTGSGS